MIFGWFRALIAFVMQSLWPIQTPLAAASVCRVLLFVVGGVRWWVFFVRFTDTL